MGNLKIVRCDETKKGQAALYHFIIEAIKSGDYDKFYVAKEKRMWVNIQFSDFEKKFPELNNIEIIAYLEFLKKDGFIEEGYMELDPKKECWYSPNKR